MQLTESTFELYIYAASNTVIKRVALSTFS
jgi:hypothetical protein